MRQVPSSSLFMVNLVQEPRTESSRYPSSTTVTLVEAWASPPWSSRSILTLRAPWEFMNSRAIRIGSRAQGFPSSAALESFLLKEADERKLWDSTRNWPSGCSPRLQDARRRMTKRTVNIPESVPHQPIVLNKAPEHRITLEAPCIDAHGPDLPPLIVLPSPGHCNVKKIGRFDNPR